MSYDKSIDPLVDGAKTAAIHFSKAAFEVATGIGALLAGITQIVWPGEQDGEETASYQTVEVE